MRRQRNVHFNSLMRFLNRARKEVDNCAKANAYLAGCVLIGAMTECLLMAMLRMFPDVVYRHRRKLTEHWSLKSLNEFARECGWFDQTIYDATERIRRNRNLLHPNWYASRQPPRITRKMLEARQDDFDVVRDCITSWVI